MRGLAQRVQTRSDTSFLGDEYAFLVGRLLDRATLDRAQHEARQSGVATHAVLIASGWISQADYAAALAQGLGVEAAPWDLVIDGDSAAMQGAEAEQGLPAVIQGRACRVLSATSAAPSEFGRRVAMLRNRGHQVMLAPQSAIDAVREVHGWGDRIYEAVRRLLRERPADSAGTRTSTWQMVAAAGAVGATIGGVFVVPAAAIAALTGLMALPFLCVTLLRLVALRQILAGSGAAARTPDPDPARLADQSLPVYSVLVPLLREGSVLAGLGRGLIKSGPKACRGKEHGGEVVAGEFVEARCDASEVLELVEAALNEVSLAVELGIDGALHPSGAQGRNVGSCASCFDELDDGAGVIAAVGDEVARQSQPVDQVGHGGFVGSLARREHQAHRKPSLVDHGIDLSAQSATRTADGVIRAPFLPPAACWCARTIELSMNCSDLGDRAASASNRRTQMPAFAQRLKRL
jgi:hypothetical protein